MSPKEQKQILTRANCEKELKQTYRVLCRGNLIMLLIFSVICIPLASLPWLVVKEMSNVTVPIYVIAVVVTLIMASPALYWVYQVCIDFYHLRLVYTRKFSIVEDEVSYLSEGESERRHTVNAAYFCRYDRCVIGDSATWGITHPGDTFYLLILHTKKPKIVNYFPTKIYQLQEEPNVSHNEKKACQ